MPAMLLMLPSAITWIPAVSPFRILLPKSDMVERALPALMKQCKVPVFLGGHASVKVHDSLKRLGVNVLGTDLNKGLARLRDIVPENQSGVGENAGNVSN